MKPNEPVRLQDPNNPSLFWHKDPGSRSLCWSWGEGGQIFNSSNAWPVGAGITPERVAEWAALLWGVKCNSED